MTDKKRCESVIARTAKTFAVAVMMVLGFERHSHAAPSAAELEQAGNLFAISCSSSFCHGEAGIGGRGPMLRNRNMPPDYVRNTILQGRSGTAMPSFKDAINAQELDMIVAYVMSLSPNYHPKDSGAGGAAAPSGPPAPLSPQARLGSAIFFDPSRPGACAECHSYAQRGGPVGPDLTAIAKKSPKDIYDAIVAPAAANPDYPVIAVTAADGEHDSGILDLKDDAVVRLYDLSAGPPVLRSFYMADGAKVDASAPATVPYRHTLDDLSQDQIADLVAFLKSDGGGSKPVTPKDLTAAREKR
jgi:putative heme-binding domain-containing protein